MELYLDSANLKEFNEAFDLGFLYGLTTTPTFMHREGITDIDGTILELAKIVPILQIEALEREQSDLSAQLSDAQLYMNRPTEAQALQERATQVSETLNQLLVRWETLLQRQEQAWQ